jgi:hypothetical protein
MLIVEQEQSLARLGIAQLDAVRVSVLRVGDHASRIERMQLVV